MVRDLDRLRVLLLLRDASLTGPPTQAREVFARLHEQVDLFTVVSRGGPLADEFKALGPIALDALPARTTFWNRLLARCRLERLRAAIARWNPNLIYVNSIAALPVARRLRLAPVPVLVHVHEIGLCFAQYNTSALFSWLTNRPTRFVVVSEAAKGCLAGGHVLQSDPLVLHSFADPERFSRTAARSRLNGRRFTVGGCGWVGWCKGPELWLLTAKHVQRLLGNRVRFVWVGVEGDDAGRAMAASVQKLGLEEVVELHPKTPHPESAFAEFDVFALTSWEDACPLVVVENMLMENPVLCFRGSGGAAEQVGATGVIIDPFSPEMMADEIGALFSDQDRRSALGVAARQRALAHFTLDVQLPKLRELFFETAGL